MNPTPLFLPCANGVEALLADEVRAILAPVAPRALETINAGRGGVGLLGSSATAMRLHLHSRLAQRVLWQIAAGPYRDEQDLYALAMGVRWGDWITPKNSIRVDTTAIRSPLQSLHFASLRIKDAVCDALRASHGARPDVDPRHPDLSLVLHLHEDHAALSIDLSGEALFKRGWREAKGEAPLKETLAAAMLAAAGWHGREEDGDLLDPCCGAGTIAIEAAQIACGIAPGLQRSFAFEKLAPFRAEAVAWQQMKTEAREARHAPAVAIHAGDVSFRMTDFATRNAERAGVMSAIQFKTADALQRPAPGPRGVLIMNPPYGERIEAKGSGSGGRPSRENDRWQSAEAWERPGQRDDAGAREGFEGATNAATFFSSLAAHWKRQYGGWTAWVLSPDAKLPSAMRLKESRRIPMWNGPIECRLFRFDLVAGSMRESKPASGLGQVEVDAQD
ncbi:THUMP domain-containing class I SAM-dependent RNA methyltransferase [Sphaerotilus mobilis]|uniref:Putative N6-adenine-specific DNA methylase n=1 Tax=Sphaerotilus mobilis TaxID=47994 RepID=A0A4Q7LKN5_9BURK|nr:THUMP domain-containing protein [Sphaerotilus mobilis]RZS54742.1 putative N6-adenine-specific DNA methylase [Sphaerotilus mobilis]